ncbi:hypothetical protein SBBP2_2180009 [Burkholderiales bacterium]|nr:hypothetical protein SBBP2_2180009 [Burkholderiales bacterium]
MESRRNTSAFPLFQLAFSKQHWIGSRAQSRGGSRGVCFSGHCQIFAWWQRSEPELLRQQLLRALVADIIVDVDEAAREIILTIHWRGGQHSQLRVRKPKSGEHGCITPDEALAIIGSMAGRWSDEEIAASLKLLAQALGRPDAVRRFVPMLIPRQMTCRYNAQGYDSDVRHLSECQ